MLLKNKSRIFSLLFSPLNNRDEEPPKLFRLPPGYVWGVLFEKAWVCVQRFYWKDKIKPNSLAGSSLAAAQDLGHYLWPDDLLGSTMKMLETCHGIAIYLLHPHLSCWLPSTQKLISRLVAKKKNKKKIWGWCGSGMEESSIPEGQINFPRDPLLVKSHKKNVTFHSQSYFDC